MKSMRTIGWTEPQDRGERAEVAYFSFPADLVEDLVVEGVLPPWEIHPTAAGSLIIQWLDVAPCCDLADRVVDAFQHTRETVH